MTISHEDLQAVVPRVLSRLRAMTPLPPQGTVAGQSVASLVFEELGLPLRGPINDVDIFVNSSLPRTQRGLPDLPPEIAANPYNNSIRTTQKTVTHRTNATSEWDHYSQVKFIALRSTIQILRTYQVDLANYTLIQYAQGIPGSQEHPVVMSQELVQGFDINAVAVGINLASEEIVCTPAFLDFLNNRQLRVATCNTPAHTMVRLAKKWHGGEITGAECDFATERHLLEMALLCQSVSDGSNSYALNDINAFGLKYKALYERFSAHLPALEEQHNIQTNPDGTTSRGYTLYAFSGLSPQTPSDHLLLSASARSTPPVDIIAYVRDFPEVFGLFNAIRTPDMPQAIRSDRQAAFVDIASSASPGHNLNLLQKALGRPSILHTIPGMDECDQSAFFLGQKCTKDPIMVQRAIAAVSSLSETDLRMVARMDLKADAVLDISAGRRADVLRRLMVESNSVLLWQAPVWTKDAPREEKSRCVHELVAVVEDSVARGLHADDLSNIVRTSLFLEEETDQSSRSVLNVVWDACPSVECPSLCTRLLKLGIPQWPDSTGLSRVAVANVVAQLIVSGQEVPADLWDRACADAALVVQRLASSIPNTSLAEGVAGPVVRSLLDRIPDHKLMERSGFMLRLLLAKGFAKTVEDILLRQNATPEQLALEEHMWGKITADSKFDFTINEEERANRVHFNPEEDRAAQALRDKLSLSRAVSAQGAAPRPSRRF